MAQIIVSDSNLTPVVQIVTWMSLVISALAFFTHAGITIYTSRAVNLETVLVFCSLVLSPGIVDWDCSSLKPLGFWHCTVYRCIGADIEWLWKALKSPQ